MPYVPSQKTPNSPGLKDEEGQALDREILDKAIDELANQITDEIKTNRDIAKQYLYTFIDIGNNLINAITETEFNKECPSINLVEKINRVSNAHKYEGAFLGELNYSITRLIQEIPKKLVKKEKQKKEIRYFIYAYTVEALVKVSYYFNKLPGIYGIAGVFEDIKDEYKRRVNTSYEAAQIVKSGDCYDTPYHTVLMEIIDEDTKKTLGYQEVMVKRDEFIKNVETKKDVNLKTSVKLKTI